jgi:tetratricopeptide (TPR) repeat protein
LIQEGKLSEAEATYREALVIAEKRFPDGFSLFDMQYKLRRVLCSQGKFVEARALMIESLKTGSTSALNFVAWNFATAPEPEMRDGSNAVIFAEKAVAETNHTNVPFLDTLAAAYAEIGQFDKAIATQQEAIERLTERNQKQGFTSRLKLYEAGWPMRDHGALAEKVKSLLDAGKFAEAETVARECFAYREKLIPGTWYRFNAGSMLGGSLLGQKKYTEAEPLLLSGYEGLKQRKDQIPAGGQSYLEEARQRLVQLYEQTNRPDQAAKLKSGVESSNPPASR